MVWAASAAMASQGRGSGAGHGTNEGPGRISDAIQVGPPLPHPTLGIRPLEITVWKAQHRTKIVNATESCDGPGRAQAWLTGDPQRHSGRPTVAGPMILPCVEATHLSMYRYDVVVLQFAAAARRR